MSVQSRIDKINQIAQITREVYRRDSSHKVYHVDSLRTGKPYQVIADTKMEAGIMVIDTFLFSFDHKEQPHPANQSKHICYQVLGALKFAAKKAGYILSECNNYDDAKRVARFGGKMVLIRNQGRGVVWAVAQKQTEQKPKLDLRMRQTIKESYID